MRLPNLPLSIQRASLLSLTATLSLPLLAQEQVRQRALEEVVITAQKRQESLQESPVAVTAFTSENLDNLGIVDVSGVTGRVPNTMLLATPSSNINMSASVRGITSNEPSLAQDAKIGLYLDGVYIGKNSGAIFDIADLERIEVLRGPQGTLYGKNTTGGAINIITERPLGEFGFKQKLTLGNFGRTRSQTSIDLPRTMGLATKLSYMTRSYEGWARNSNPRGPRQLGRDDTSGYRLAFNWELSDRLTADYSLDRTWGAGTARPSQLSYANPDYVNLPVITPTGMIMPGAENHPFRQMLESGISSKRQKRFDLDNANEERYDIRGHSLTLSWDADTFEIKSITGYREMDIRLKPGATDNDGGAWSVPVLHNATVRNGGNSKEYEQWSQELQIIGDALGSRVTYIAGLYYYEDEGQELNSYWDALVPFNGALLSTQLIPAPAGLGESYSVKNKSYAAFGQATYTPDWLDSRLSLTLGLRQTWDEKEAKILDTGGAPWSTDKEWDSFNPSFTVDYQWYDDINVYAKVATGYTAGSHPIRSSNEEAFNLYADPEEIINYELGIKSDWFNRRLRINAATFFYDYTDLQVTDFQSGATVVTNAGEAELTGFELELTALPLPGVTVDLTYGYLDFEYQEYLTTVEGVPMDVSDTARAPNAPRHTARLLLNYDFEPMSFGALSVSLESVYTDAYHFNPRQFQHDAADSRNLLNARVNLTDIPLDTGSLRAGLWVRNLSDKEYREYGIDFGAIGHAVNTYGEPRSFGVDLMYEY